MYPLVALPTRTPRSTRRSRPCPLLPPQPPPSPHAAPLPPPQRGRNASQLNLGGTRIGAFNDRCAAGRGAHAPGHPCPSPSLSPCWRRGAAEWPLVCPGCVQHCIGAGWGLVAGLLSGVGGWLGGWTEAVSSSPSPALSVWGQAPLKTHLAPIRGAANT